MFDFLSFLVGLLTAAVVFLGLEVHNLKAKIVVAPVEEAPVEEAPVEEAPVEETPVEETPVVNDEQGVVCSICHYGWRELVPEPVFGMRFCIDCEDRFQSSIEQAAYEFQQIEDSNRERGGPPDEYYEDDSGSEDRETPPSYSEQE